MSSVLISHLKEWYKMMSPLQDKRQIGGYIKYDDINYFSNHLNEWYETC